MSQALSFNDVSLVPVPVNNNDSIWLRAADIAKALGYQREDKVSRLYQRNADEFTPDMTQVIEITADPHFGTEKNLSDGRCRIFSLRGCHLLAMFSRTPVAKSFRKWVLDVLDRLAEEEQAALPHGDTLTAAEQAQLQAIVQAKAGMVPADMQRKAFAEMWTRFNRHFRIARYAQLPPAKMGEAVEYLVGMEVKTPSAALPATAQPALPAAKENTEFLPSMFPTFEKDIMDIERLIERLCNGMSIFARPGSMMYSELVRNKQLIDAVQPCISAAKNAVGTGFFMMQTARKIYGAMK